MEFLSFFHGGTLVCLMGVLTGHMLYRHFAPVATLGTAIAIDLGTTHSSVGIYKDGQVEIIKLVDNEHSMPSCVFFMADGKVVIGKEAKQQQLSYPERVICGAKRLLGRSWDDPVVKKHRKLVPYVMINKNNRPYVQVMVNEKIVHYTPQKICGIIVEDLKKHAEATLGGNINKSVATVPGSFSNSEREAIKETFKEAGLTVMRIVNNPTAVAITYDIVKKKKASKEQELPAEEEKEHEEETCDVESSKEEEHQEQPKRTVPGTEKEEDIVLVCDIGSGNVGISLVSITKGVYKVIATGGNSNLGGDDFTLRVIKHINKTFIEKYGDKTEVTPKGRFQLYLVAEEAKINLSTVVEAKLHVSDYYPGIHLDEVLTRSQFEEINEDLFSSIKRSVEKVIEDSGVPRSKVTAIPLTGGTTSIPKVREVVSECFDGKEVISVGGGDDENQDGVLEGGTAVADGISNLDHTNAPVIFDVTPLTLGIDSDHGLMSVILKRNTVLPAKKTGNYTNAHDYQTTLAIKVYEGERPIAERNNLVGQFDIDIPLALMGKEPINVTFSIDQDGILNVTAIVKSTGEKAGITVTKYLKGHNLPQLEEILGSEEQFIDIDNAEVQRINALRVFEKMLYFIRTVLFPDVKKAATPSKAREIFEEGISWLRKNIHAETTIFQKRAEDLKKTMRELLGYDFYSSWEPFLDIN